MKVSGPAVLVSLLEGVENSSAGLKSVIAERMKVIDERTYWYFTEDDADFLANVYDRQSDKPVLKNRIMRITNEAMQSVFAEIVTGQLKKAISEDEEDKLQIGVGVQDFYETVPVEDKRGVVAKEKLKEINEDLKSFKERMQMAKHKIAQRKAEKAAMESEFKRSLEKEKKQEHRQHIKKHIDQLKRKEQQRKKSNQKFKSFYKEYKKVKPLHVLMEQLYHEKVELPELQASRQKLDSIAQRKKPTLEEINDHDRTYMVRKAARPERSVVSYSVEVPYKSQFYQQEQRRLREKEQQDEYGQQWDYVQKQKRYSQFVQDRHRPRIDRQKRKQSQEMIHPSPTHKQALDRSSLMEVGNGYLQYVHRLQKRKAVTPSQPIEPISQSRYVNYLQDLKARGDHKRYSTMSWESDLRDRSTTQMEKRQRIIRKSKQLEERARMDQKFISHYNYGRAEQIIQKKKQIDEVILSSIKAKVAVLRQAKKQAKRDIQTTRN